VECRAGTSIFGHFAGVGGGTVRIFYFPWLRFGVYGAIEMVGVAGQYGFFSFPGSVLAGTVRLKWWGVLYLTFHFPQFVVSSLGGWICAVGILRYIFYGIL
jgi:hypothetical protein